MYTKDLYLMYRNTCMIMYVVCVYMHTSIDSEVLIPPFLDNFISDWFWLCLCVHSLPFLLSNSKRVDFYWVSLTLTFDVIVCINVRHYQCASPFLRRGVMPASKSTTVQPRLSELAETRQKRSFNEGSDNWGYVYSRLFINLITCSPRASNTNTAAALITKICVITMRCCVCFVA